MNKTKNNPKKSLSLKEDLKKYAGLYLIVLPVVIYYLLFCYKPMYGLIIAFKNFKPGLGIWDSPWAKNFGFQHFIDFFQSVFFGRVLSNTLIISISCLIFGFTAPIVLAILLSEIRNEKFKRVVQTVSYMPHFISLVVVCGLIKLFVADDGIISYALNALGIIDTDRSLLSYSNYFVPTYVISNIWQEVGWGSIIYLAAIAGIDPSLYEAADMDGAGRWRKMWHITLAGISNTIIIMLLLRIGSLMSIGHEKIVLLYNEGIYETADVISTFVYRKGLLEYEYSYGAAVGVFNSIINFALILIFNRVSKKYTETSLW